jgi:hypothetical protein
VNASTSSSPRRQTPTTQLGLFGGVLAPHAVGGRVEQSEAPHAEPPKRLGAARHAVPNPAPLQLAASPVLRVLEAAGCLAGSGPNLEARLELSHFAVKDLAAEWEGAESTVGLATAARRVAAMLAAIWPR